MGRQDIYIAFNNQHREQTEENKITKSTGRINKLALRLHTYNIATESIVVRKLISASLTSYNTYVRELRGINKETEH